MQGVSTVPKLARLESELRERARELIHAGRLPDVVPTRMWGGRGSGQTCALCGDVVPQTEVEYELEPEPGTVLHFHFMCHAAWQLECVRATPGKTEAPSPGMAASGPQSSNDLDPLDL